MVHLHYPSAKSCLPSTWLSRIAFFGLVAGFIPLGKIEAALIAYRNAAQFAAATVGRTTNLVNFDSTAVGTVVGKPIIFFKSAICALSSPPFAW